MEPNWNGWPALGLIESLKIKGDDQLFAFSASGLYEAYLLQQIQLLALRGRCGLPPWSPAGNRSAEPVFRLLSRVAALGLRRGRSRSQPVAPHNLRYSRKNCGPIAAGVTTVSPFTSSVPLLSNR
jgi:hypothetical protein